MPSRKKSSIVSERWSKTQNGDQQRIYPSPWLQYFTLFFYLKGFKKIGKRDHQDSFKVLSSYQNTLFNVALSRIYTQIMAGGHISVRTAYQGISATKNRFLWYKYWTISIRMLNAFLSY